MFACTGAKLLALLAESALYNSLAHSFSRDNQEKGGWRQFPTPAEAGGSLAAFSYGLLRQEYREEGQPVVHCSRFTVLSLLKNF